MLVIHILIIWYITNQTRKLPKKVKQVFDYAVEGRAGLWFPLAALWEFSLLLKAGRFKLDLPLEELIANDFFANGIHLLDFSAEDIVQAAKLNFSRDPFDTMIVACARRIDCHLITGDSIIHKQAPCKIYW
jgi:PIN domain nuclease of toxin-antitoxin system